MTRCGECIGREQPRVPVIGARSKPAPKPASDPAASALRGVSCGGHKPATSLPVPSDSNFSIVVLPFSILYL